MKRSFLKAAGSALLIISVALCGCSSSRSLLKSIRSSKPVLAKRVKVVPFLDETHLGGKLGQAFTGDFVAKLKKIPSVVLDETPFELPTPENMKSLRFGIVTPKNYIVKAVERGLNILITGVVNPVDVTVKRAGIWPFRKNTRFYEISAVVNLIDVTSGAVLFTHLESKTYKGSEDEYADNGKEFMAELVRSHLPEILKKQVSAVSNVIEGLPWIGKVVASEGTSIRVNGGRDVGMKEGYVFRVFSQGKWIKGINERPYPVRSREVGEIEVVSLGAREATAKPVSGGPFTVGEVILLKD